MKRLLFSLLLCLPILVSVSCAHKKDKPVVQHGGVILTFDDAYVDEWYEADQLLKPYGWKATFCVCRIDSIGAPQIQKLYNLQKEGHEIAGHGYHHFNAVKYVAANGIPSYLREEIDPMIAAMKRRKVHSASFAYPYGERSAELDSALTLKFNIIRGRAFCDDTPEKEGCYFRGSKFVYAFDIDNSHVHFSIPYLLELLDDAKRTNKILVLCSHRPVKNITANYQTKFETLEFVCKYMKLNHMKFYTLSDLNQWLPK
jgi:hypothetical protein